MLESIKMIRVPPVAKIIVYAVMGLAALIASAKIQVPMIPVPITFQTAVVLILPCLMGWRAGSGVVMSYLALGLMGLPVFAMAAGAMPGPAYFIGPTGGYLAGFIIAAFMTGWLYERRSDWPLWQVGGLMLAGHAIILALGVLWLAFGVPHLGLAQAIATGLIPFISGSVLKAAIAAAFIKAVAK